MKFGDLKTKYHEREGGGGRGIQIVYKKLKVSLTEISLFLGVFQMDRYLHCLII